MKPVKLDHPLVGGLQKGHLHQISNDCIRAPLHFLFSKFYWFHFCSIGWKCCNLNSPAQTAEENEPVFDEQNLVLSPGVNTHT